MERDLVPWRVRKKRTFQILAIKRVLEPGIRRTEISRQQIADSIAAEVAYACSYWVWHLVEGGEQPCDNGQTHQFSQADLLLGADVHPYAEHSQTAIR